MNSDTLIKVVDSILRHRLDELGIPYVEDEEKPLNEEQFQLLLNEVIKEIVDQVGFIEPNKDDVERWLRCLNDEGNLECQYAEDLAVAWYDDVILGG